MNDFLKLNDISSYKSSLHLSNYLWKITLEWDYFAKDTVGKQYVKAMDSISANIAEGFGRFTKKDKIRFYRYSQGSRMESLDWNEKAKIRELISKDQYEHILGELKKLHKDINSLIKFTHEKLTM